MASSDPSLTGHIDDASNLRVAGWAADLSEPNDAIVVVIWVDGREVGRTCADQLRRDLAALGTLGDGRHGFDYRFEIPLSGAHDHSVIVTFARSGGVVPNGRSLVYGSEAPSLTTRLVADEDRILRPLLISCTGRSGSTILTKLLLDHPEVIGGKVFPYEVRVAAYFANLHRILSRRADAYGPEITETFDAYEEMTTVNPFYHVAYRDVSLNPNFLSNFFGATAQEEFGRMFRRLVETFYLELANEQSRHTPKYFTEKCDVTRLSRQAFRELYGDLREILLVRDLRDVVCSSRRFFMAPEVSTFDHLAWVGNALCEARERADGGETLVVRYEDLILSRESTLTVIAEFLGIADYWPRDADFEKDLHDRHGTSESPRLSIGRWKRELTAEETEYCQSKFGSYLSMFGYA